METNPHAIIFSAPSGAGKTTLVQHILKMFTGKIELSVSATNREKREGEINGKHYHFLSTEQIQKHIKQNDFVECEEVYEGSFYGTLKSEVHRIAKSEKAIIFDVDVKGAISLKKYFGESATVIFVTVPPEKNKGEKLKTLKDRLYARNTETPEKIQQRVSRAEEELDFEKSPYVNSVIMNDNVEKAKIRAYEEVLHALQVSA